MVSVKNQLYDDSVAVAVMCTCKYELISKQEARLSTDL